MSTVNIRIKGVRNVAGLYELFKANKTWHMPFRFIASPDEYEITLKEQDPMVSFLQLRYSGAYK
jgi:hypothetical protein